MRGGSLEGSNSNQIAPVSATCDDHNVVQATAECAIVTKLDKHGLCSLEMCEPGAAAADCDKRRDRPIKYVHLAPPHTHTL